MSINRVVTITIGGIVYNAKATIGMYAKACEIAGVDLSVLFGGTLLPAKLVIAFAQAVSDRTSDDISENMMMDEYVTATESILQAIVSGIDGNATNNATQQVDEQPKN